MARRYKSATESLLQIAIGIEMALVFFGALALNGLGVYEGPVVAIGAAAALLFLAILYRAVAYPIGRWVGHVVQVALLLSFLWDEVIGFSALVGIGFWVFGAIRGPQLDRGSNGLAQ